MFWIQTHQLHSHPLFIFCIYACLDNANNVVHDPCLCCTVLYCAVLCCAVLYCAVLCCTVLCCAVLCCAVLCCTVLCCAVLCTCTVYKTEQLAKYSLDFCDKSRCFDYAMEIYCIQSLLMKFSSALWLILLLTVGAVDSHDKGY